MLRRLALRLQLLLGAFSITVLLAVGLFSVLPGQLDDLGRKSVEQEAISLVNLVANLSGVGIKMAESLDDVSFVKDSLAPVRSMSQVRSAAIYAPSGKLLVRHSNNVAAPVPLPSVDRVGDVGLVWGEANLVVWRVIRDGQGQELGSVALDFSLERLEALRAQNLRTATILTASMGAGLMFGLLLLGTRLTAPVVRLTAVADQISAGRLQSFPTLSPDASHSNNELQRLTNAFFTMLSRLKESQHALRQQVEEVERQRLEADAAREQAEVQRQEAEVQRREADSERARAEQALLHLQQTQQQLIRSEKLASLEQLVAGIAHEINTPIGAVNASAEILEDRLRIVLDELHGSGDPTATERYATARALIAEAAGRTRLGGRTGRRVRRALAKELESREFSDSMVLADNLLEIGYRPDETAWQALVERSDLGEVVRVASLLSPLVRNAANVKLAAQRARKIVLALKTFSHQGGSGDRTAVSLLQSIQTVLTLYENQFKMGVQLEVSIAKRHWVLGDADVLAQVWTNLIQNAFQAMKGRGRLWLRSEEVVPERYRVIVGNDGPAIPPEVQERIFEPFFTTKPAGEGTGLGLDIVRRIVEEHGGALHVTSSEEATEFVVELPCYDIGKQEGGA